MSSLSRARRFSRSRGFIIAAAMVVGIVVVQMITSVVGVMAVTRQTADAAVDTFGYVGDLTAERVARYAEAAADVSAGTAVQIEQSPELPIEELATSMYLRLQREPTVRSLYVGWPDGSYLIVRRDGTGYDVVRRAGPVGETTYSADHDVRFVKFGEVETASNYDPRDRPWYEAGQRSPNGAWTQPYLQFASNETLVSAAQAARSAGGVTAVVGADLELESLGQVLDDLPLGDGAEAFVLAPDGDLIAAPSSRHAQAEAITVQTQEVATAAALGLDMQPGPLVPGVDYVEREFDMVVLERTVEPQAEVEWVLHLRADEAQVSPGLDRLSNTVFAITAFSLIVTIAAIVLALRVWRPLRAMRERASTDQLTGLANRHEYLRRGATLVARALARGDTVLVVVFDLDHFKQLNDMHGHDAGDHALETVALSMREHIRAGDIAARTGGDEFVVVQVLRAGDDPHEVVSRTRNLMERALHTRVEGGAVVGVSAGFAATSQHTTLDALVGRADAALVAGKREAKGRVYEG